jgi:hypothetical protein
MNQKTRAMMITLTTYGTWLRGDERGWVDDGITFPPDPILEFNDLQRMKHTPFLFDLSQLEDVGNAIGNSLIDRMGVTVYALAVQTWHTHFVCCARKPVSEIIKCAKDAARYCLRPGRPIWTEGHDKRFCFDNQSVINRINYVEKHNLQLNWRRNPWEWTTPFKDE